MSKASKSRPIWERLSAPKDKGDEWRNEKRKKYADEASKRFSKCSNGFFGSPGSLAVGTPYKDPDYALKHPRGGAQFHTLGSGKVQKSPDGALSKSPSIHSGDLYTDPGRKRIDYLNKMKKKYLDRPSFKPSGKIRNALPIFQSEFDANTEPSEVKRLLAKLNDRGPKVKKENFEPRNFTTSPAKKGSFGTAGTLMPQYAEEVQGMWKIMPEEYDRARQLQREEAKKHRDKLEGRPAFKSRAALKRETFSSHAECYGKGSSENKVKREKGRHTRLALEKAKAARERYLKRKEEEAAQERPLWRPNNPLKKSMHFDKQMTLSKYPEHLPDPKDFKNPYFALEKPRKGQVPWIPNNQKTSTPIKSVIVGTISQRLYAAKAATGMNNVK